MRKTLKILLTFVIIFTAFTGVVSAVENEYLLTKEIVYKNDSKAKLKNGFVEIMIGQVNFTQYAKDEYVKITPTPDKIEKDKFGNMYAYYDAKGMLANEELTITIERKSTTSSFATETPILARSNGSVTEENKIYVEPQERIESDETEIINKSTEITKNLSTDYRKAQAIFEFVNTQMKYVTTSSASNSGALAALKSMQGVCEEFATLFVALCRAQEIPARAVAGYKIENPYSNNVNLIDHVWAEIYLDDYGWLPVEPTIEYTVNGSRLPYWNMFCALSNANYIPTDIYYCENGNRRYKNMTEVSYKATVLVNNKISEPQKNMFKDIEKHVWAQDSIQELFGRKIVEGYSAFEYGPDRNITRIEFICMLSRTLKDMKTNNVSNARVYYYPSYNQEHWSKEEYDFLMRCYQFYTPSDIMSAGYYNISEVFDNDIQIDKPITRAEVVALMDIFMEDTVETKSFTDVWSTTRFASSIQKAYSNGLIEGYPDGSFKPNATITRAEMATILGRFIENNTYIIK